MSGGGSSTSPLVELAPLFFQDYTDQHYGQGDGVSHHSPQVLGFAQIEDFFRIDLDVVCDDATQYHTHQHERKSRANHHIWHQMLPLKIFSRGIFHRLASVLSESPSRPRVPDYIRVEHS